MKIKTPFIFRVFGYLRAITDKYSYSENIFEQLKDKPVYFVQIGANDGVSQDPIYKYSNSWDGILIEPIPESFSRLKENYKNTQGNKKFENIAISTFDGEISLYVPHKDGINNEYYLKIVSQNKQLRTLNDSVLDEIKVPCLSLNSLIEKHKISQIDLLVIDIEGYEMELLNQYDFKIKPKIIYFESRFYSFDVLVAANKRFLQLGYRIFPEKDNCLLILK